MVSEIRPAQKCKSNYQCDIPWDKEFVSQAEQAYEQECSGNNCPTNPSCTAIQFVIKLATPANAPNGKPDTKAADPHVRSTTNDFINACHTHPLISLTMLRETMLLNRMGLGIPLQERRPLRFQIPNPSNTIPAPAGRRNVRSHPTVKTAPTI